MIEQYIQIFLHLNVYLASFVSTYGNWTYAVLFIIIFLESGVILTPILPGETLLFAAGTLAAVSTLKVYILVIVLITATVMGGIINFWIGVYLGHKILRYNKSKLIQKYIDKTYHFYKKYGSFTIMIARLIPIVRTYAPFIAGVVKMRWWVFSLYNFLGGVLWIIFFVSIGYFLGNIPLVKKHFSLFIVTIIVISILPGIIEFLRQVKKIKKATI